MQRLRSWFRRRRDRELERELRFHIEQHVRDLVARGVPAERAKRQAQLELGGLTQVKEQLRDSRPAAWLDRLACDARDAWRAARRTPATALTAAGLIALVIGGNTTLFSMINGLLSKPAPGVLADRLVTLEPRLAGRVGFGHSYLDYLDYQAQTGAFSSLLACDFASFTVTVPEGTYAFRGTKVTSNYFDTLGVALAKGRTFSDQETRDASGLTAIISYRLWQEQFHGSEDILGQPLLINGHPATVIGVAPAAFQGATLVELAQVWVPLVAYARLEHEERVLNDRASGTLFVIGQLARGVSMRRAQAELSAVDARLAAAYPDSHRQRTARTVRYSMTAGGSSLVSERGSTFLAICYVITALTVLLVCANVANLMIARAAARERETALRRSLGAPRLSIVRSLLLEGLGISLLGCAAAYVFAIWTARAVLRLFPPAAAGARLPLDFSPDWRVASYAMLVAVSATVVFSLPPAFRVWRQNLLSFLKAGEQGVVQGRTKLSNVLVIVQLAFAVLLLTSAGLAYRSTSLISTRDLGFEPGHLLLATISTTGASTNREGSLALLSRIEDRLRAGPGILGVSYAQFVPTMPGALWPEQAVGAPGVSASERAWVNNVGPSYLNALGLSPMEGREFSQDDRPAQPVAMVNRDLADVFWPGQSAVGRTLALGAERRLVTVVAVAPNAMFSGYGNRERPLFVLLPYAQTSTRPGQISFYIRHSGSLELAAGEVRRALRDVDARVPIVYMRPLNTELSAATWPIRFIYVLLSLFAVGALLIAAAGQYAVIAFDVRRRTREFGVRMALGASSGHIVGSVMRQGLVWSAVGLTCGVLLSAVVSRALRSVLFGITPTDAATFVGVMVVLSSTSMLACYIPARRAAHVDPLKALRYD